MICLESSLRVLSEIIILLSNCNIFDFHRTNTITTISLVMISFLSFYNFYLKPKTVLWGRKKQKLLRQFIKVLMKVSKDLRN